MIASNDPQFRELIDWAEARREGRGDAANSFAVPALVVVPASAEALRWIDSFLDAALVLPLPRPPAELRGRLRASFARHRTLHAEPPIDGERLELVADSRRDRTLVGVRSAESGGDARFELAFSR